MGALMRAYDWRQSPFGGTETWPQSLKTVVRILLSLRYAMWMAWGPELTFFCNDAYRPTLGVKQSWALGESARRVWAEIWNDISPRIDTVLNTGIATYDQTYCFSWNAAASRKRPITPFPIARLPMMTEPSSACFAW